MFRLVIVAGPNRGSSFALTEGENRVGRQLDNHIVLSGVKVSKLHCSILVNGSDVFLRDEGSRNGTFLNGTLTRKSPMAPGQKIGIGEFVLELVGAVASRNIVIPQPQVTGSYPTFQPPHVAQAQDETPKELPDQIKGDFEKKLMPIFYDWLTKTDLKTLLAAFVGLVAMVSMAGALLPLTDLAEKNIKAEALLKVTVVGREIADRFGPQLIQSQGNSPVDLGYLSDEDSLRFVAIVSTDLHYLAPSQRVGQMMGGGLEGLLVQAAIKDFKAGRETGFGRVQGTVATYIHPIRFMDPKELRPRIAGVVVVSRDFSGNTIDITDLSITYGFGFVVAGLIAFLVYLILGRLIYRPFELLNEELDQALRGEVSQISKPFQIQGLDSLWDNLNVAVGKFSTRGGGGGGSSDLEVQWDHEMAPLQALADATECAFLALDPEDRVISLNPMFDELSGIHLSQVGSSIHDVARDQAFIALMRDMKDRVHGSPSRSAQDQFEFQGMPYLVTAVQVGPMMKSGVAFQFRRRG